MLCCVVSFLFASCRTLARVAALAKEAASGLLRAHLGDLRFQALRTGTPRSLSGAGTTPFFDTQWSNSTHFCTDCIVDPPVCGTPVYGTLRGSVSRWRRQGAS